jgi:CheY-like chemotaxis protein
VELHAVVEPAVETVKALVESRGHTLTVDLPPQPVWLHGDPVRLSQILGNLLHNAAKFTDPGGRIALSVTLPQPDRIRIAVTDNGIGITSYNLARIFGMFTQGASTRDRMHDGLGIGLSLVSRLVEMHGGTVEAFSDGIGHGSTFVLEFPLRQPVTASPVAAPVAPATPGAQRLLLVDDNADSVSVMAELLTLMGHDVATAHNAEDALVLARVRQPDTILLDLGLPGTDGYTLARMLRAEPAFAQTRLIAHTGYGSEQDRERSRLAGFDYHLVKPANFDDLERALQAEH